MAYLVDIVATANDAALSAEQMTSVSTALTNTANTILDTFIGLLPIIALIVGVMFAIKFIKGRFSELKKTR